MNEKFKDISAEDHLYELFTLSIMLVLSLGYITLGIRKLLLGISSISAENEIELVAGVTAIYASLLVHEALHGVALKYLGLKPRTSIVKFKGYLPILEVIDKSNIKLGYRDISIILLTPASVSLIIALASIFLFSIDYPLFLLSLGIMAISSWDFYLLIILRKFRKALFVYQGLKILIFGNLVEISRRMAVGFEEERYLKHWTGWVWFIIFIEFIMFILVSLGSIGFHEGLTLRIGPILIFSVELTEGGFKTAFSLPGAFIVAILLAIPLAYISKRIAEWFA